MRVLLDLPDESSPAITNRVVLMVAQDITHVLIERAYLFVGIRRSLEWPLDRIDFREILRGFTNSLSVLAERRCKRALLLKHRLNVKEHLNRYSGPYRNLFESYHVFDTPSSLVDGEMRQMGMTCDVEELSPFQGLKDLQGYFVCVTTE